MDRTISKLLIATKVSVIFFNLLNWVVSLLVDHPGLNDALFGGVVTSFNHTSLSPINGMASD